MDKDPSLPVRQALEAIDNIEKDTVGLDLAAFRKDRRARQLVERNLEIVSEASRRIPDSLKAAYPGIRWKDIAGIGNILRHEYHKVMPDMLWQTCRGSLPPLEKALKSIQRGIKKDRAPTKRPR